jgi:hypothetical protein
MVAGVNFEIRQAPRRAGDPASIVANSDQLKKLGWKPELNDLPRMIEHATTGRQSWPLPIIRAAGSPNRSCSFMSREDSGFGCLRLADSVFVHQESRVAVACKAIATTPVVSSDTAISYDTAIAGRLSNSHLRYSNGSSWAKAVAVQRLSSRQSSDRTDRRLSQTGYRSARQASIG